VHPFAATFPMLSDEELAELAADIKANGQLHPILLDPRGVLVDGRNRLAACERAGVEPRFETYDGDPVALVLSANVNRRSLTAVQKSAARARALGPKARVDGKDGRRRWKRGSLAIGESPIAAGDRKAFDLCGQIVDHDPELLDRVIAGEPLEAVLSEVEEAVAAAEAKAEAEAEHRTRVEALTAAGYMERVADGAVSFDEAWTLYEKDTAEQQRISKLPDDLAARVRDGMSIDEAEQVAVEAAASFQRGLDKIALSLKTLGRMVGYPIPDSISTALAEQHGEPYAVALKTFLTALEGIDCGFVD
jgi:ParB-like chromosome segregation protein Spo0J